ncbi:uncharacterized [Tachysurus ichikawai]
MDIRAKSLSYRRLNTASHLWLLRRDPSSNDELKELRAPSSISPPNCLIQLPGKREPSKRAWFQQPAL